MENPTDVAARLSSMECTPEQWEQFMRRINRHGWNVNQSSSSPSEVEGKTSKQVHKLLHTIVEQTDLQLYKILAMATDRLVERNSKGKYDVFARDFYRPGNKKGQKKLRTFDRKEAADAFARKVIDLAVKDRERAAIKLRLVMWKSNEEHCHNT